MLFTCPKTFYVWDLTDDRQLCEVKTEASAKLRVANMRRIWPTHSIVWDVKPLARRSRHVGA